MQRRNRWQQNCASSGNKLSSKPLNSTLRRLDRSGLTLQPASQLSDRNGLSSSIALLLVLARARGESWAGTVQRHVARKHLGWPRSHAIRLPGCSSLPAEAWAKCSRRPSSSGGECTKATGDGCPKLAGWAALATCNEDSTRAARAVFTTCG